MAKRYVIVEVWTGWKVVTAEDEDDAYRIGEPEPREGLNLSNWHVVAEEED